MKETDCQKLMVDAVQDGDIGGRGLAFNNRFIVGIPDLLLKLPGIEPVILEAKLFSFSHKTIENGHRIADIGATKLQKDQLRDWGYAGILTGVALFILPVGGNVSDLMMVIHSRGKMEDDGWSAHTDDFKPLGSKHERLQNIRQQLIDFTTGGN